MNSFTGIDLNIIRLDYFIILFFFNRRALALSVTRSKARRMLGLNHTSKFQIREIVGIFFLNNLGGF